METNSVDWVENVVLASSGQRGGDVDVSGVVFTLDECSMMKAILFDVACAFHVDGRKLPYESEVFSSIVKKVVDNTRDGGK